MKILFVSDNKIYGYGGGCVENRKYYDAIKVFCEKGNHELAVISTDVDLPEALDIMVEKDRRIDMMVRLSGHSSFLYNVWSKNLKEIKKFNADLIVLGRSRFGFIAKSARRMWPNCKIVCNVDNVEYDYVDAYFARQNGIKVHALKTIERLVVQRDEKDCIIYSDLLLFLTKRNVERYHDIYGYTKTSKIIPICMESEINLVLKYSKHVVMFVGSLDYEANILAVKTLVENIWNRKYFSMNNIELRIAGRNPSVEVRTLIAKTKGAVLIEDFSDIRNVVPNNALMLAPIEKGAGMKVKVAETLSMGIQVVASDEALIGYDEVFFEKPRGIIRANTPDEYFDVIDRYLLMSEEELHEISCENKSLFRKYYSYDRSRKEIIEAIDMVLL